MNRWPVFMMVSLVFLLHQCGAIKQVQQQKITVLQGIEGLQQECMALDTIQTILISKADAILNFDNERYDVTVTLFSRKDSLIYLSAVNSGFEIMRGLVDRDSIRVINRLHKVVYRAPLRRRFGYQYPVDFEDFQNIFSRYYLCDDMPGAHDDLDNFILFDLDNEHIKKRISLKREGFAIHNFEFYNPKTHKYLMGEGVEHGIRIFSNFMITEFEITAVGGTVTFNRDLDVKMEVNPRRYTFMDLR